MRLTISILILLWFVSCDNEKAFDCLKKTGDIVNYNVEVAAFNAIDVHDNIHVTIEQGITQQVILTTGKNLRSDITFDVIEEELVIKDGNKCNWARGYKQLNVHIITPALSKVRSSGGGVISSKGTLAFDESLTLFSELFTADFRMDVDLPSLSIVNNDLSNYYISGQVDQLTVGFYAGDGRFEGQHLIAQNANAFQRGTNDMIINALQSLNVELRSTGNVIYCTVPNTLEVLVVDDRGSVIQSCE